MLEFTLVGAPLLVITMSIVQMSLAMWQFYTMQHAIQSAARYVTLHSYGCMTNGNSCGVTVAGVANIISSQAMALDPSRLNVSLITAAGTQSCNPLTSCTSNTAQFPATGANAPGQDVKIKATYNLKDPLIMYWPGAGHVGASDYMVGASTRQRIAF
jgi:hypothetical protein